MKGKDGNMRLSNQLFASSALLLSFYLLLISSCQKDAFCGFGETNEIQLTDFRNGSSSSYLMFRTSCAEFEKKVEFTGDTLLLRLIENQDGWFFEESYSPGSPNMGTFETVQFPVYQESGFIRIPDRSTSSLFFFYGNDTIWTDGHFDDVLKQKNCLMEISGTQFIGNEIGHLEKWKIGSQKYLDQTVVSCVPGFMELEAYLVYSCGHLNGSYSKSSSIDLTQGFVRLE